MRQSEWCRQDLYSFTCIAQEGVLWNQMIKFALNTYGLSAHGQWWWIWILIWTLTWRIWAECGTRRSIGHGPSCTKFYLVIPGTECSQTQLFLISGNDPKFSYDLIKFYSSQKQDCLSSDTLSFIVTQKTLISAGSQVCHTIVHSDELLRQALCLFSGY